MGEELDEVAGALPFLVPLLILQVVLMVVALVDLVKRERVRGGNKIIWAVVIVVFNIIGPIAYLLAGRLESAGDGDPD